MMLGGIVALGKATCGQHYYFDFFDAPQLKKIHKI